MNETKNSAARAPGGDEYAGGDSEVRILHPARTREQWPPVPPEHADDLRQICLIDVETAGLDWTRHRVIEVCAARVQFDDAGNIVGIRSIGEGLEDPGHPLPPEISALTGLTDAMLSGQRINRQALTERIASCEGVIAFNAGFDRPFIEALLPDLPRVNWGCAMKDVPWRQFGFEPGPQNYLLMQAGYYPPSAHRARQDVLSLTQLLAHTCSDGESVMAKLLAAMAAPAWRFEATRAPFDAKDALKDRGYRFRKQGKGALWHKHVRHGEYDAELAWYRETIRMEPSIVELPATERYRHERSWTPVVPKGGWPKYLR
jgi:DNA polymerase-3 subunit epsilon